MRKSVVGIGAVLCLCGVVLALVSGMSRGVGAKTAATKSPISQHGAIRPALGQPTVTKTASPTSVSRAYAKLPLAFEPNRGQVNAEAKYIARGDGYTLFLTPHEAVLLLKNHPPEVQSSTGAFANRAPAAEPQSSTGRAAVALRVELLGANAAPQLIGAQELPGESNYFIGNDPAKWRTNIPNYRKVTERETYPGIDTVYYGTQRQLEYDFVVAPGVDPRLIQFAMKGAEYLRTDAQGDLHVGVPGGEVRLHKPVAYQEASGAREQVAAKYVLTGGHGATFKLGNYNPARPLIIDPILSYSTYLGGSNIDGANAIAVAPDGTAFVSGGTFSLDLPVVHALQPNHGGPDDFYRDAFVSKISADGSTLLYSTYLGGKNEDVGNGIAVDTFGDAYVIGTTLSPDFPVTSGALNTLCGGDGKCGASFNPAGAIVSNAFVSKLNPEGSGLLYSTFFGEYENVRGQAIAVDANQIAYIAGSTNDNFPVTAVPPPPPPPPFPITPNAAQPIYAGGVTDGFAAKISATGTTVEYSTYLGGSDEEIGYGIAVDSNSNAYVTGLTYSADFPVLNALQSSYGGAGDAFFSKVNTDGSGTAPGSLLYSTYLGGSNLDQGNGITVDTNGIAYMTGLIGAGVLPFSTTASLCGLPGAAGLSAVPPGSFCGGKADAFAAKMDASKVGSASRLYFTNFGGGGADSGNGIAVDPNGNSYVTGSTVSTDFPTTAAVFQPTFGGGNADAFVIKLDPAGANPLYSTFLGGTNADIGYAIAVDSSGGAYVAGQTCSLDFPLANPVQATPGGNCDAFISKVSILNGIQLNPAGLVFPAQSIGTPSQPQTVTLTNGDNSVTFNGIALMGANPGDFVETTTCGGTLVPGGHCTITVTFTPLAPGIRKASVMITDDAAGSPQVISLNGQSSTLSLSASSLAFANQHVGVASSPLAVTATNNGTTAVAFSSITASGDFSETDNCTKAPLQPTTNCVINVKYTPSTAGTSIGALTLADDAPGSPQIVLLTGSGFGQASDFAISALPPSATISAGQSARFALQVSTTGGFSQPIAVSCTGLPRLASCSVSPNPVTPSVASTQVAVSISTTVRNVAPPALRFIGRPFEGLRYVVPWLPCLIVGLIVVSVGRVRRRPARAAAFGFAAVLLLLLASCNSGNPSGLPAGTPAGTYQVVVTGTSGSLTHQVILSLEVN